MARRLCVILFIFSLPSISRDTICKALLSFLLIKDIRGETPLEFFKKRAAEENLLEFESA
jgi:hypothetical protein